MSRLGSCLKSRQLSEARGVEAVTGGERGQDRKAGKARGERKQKEVKVLKRGRRKRVAAAGWGVRN